MEVTVSSLAQMLMDGQPGETVLAALRGKYKQGSSQLTNIYKVRRIVVDAGYRNPDYDDTPLRAFASEPEVAEFLNGTLRQQVDCQRRHAKQPSWSDGAEEALRNLPPLLPPNMAAFVPTEEEVVEQERRNEKAVEQKNDNPVVVQEGDRLVELVEGMLDAASTASTYQQLVIPLLIASGRRLTELTNGLSKFEATDNPRIALFTGQLKKRGAAVAYQIPLLVKFDTFFHAWSVLRMKQARGAPLRDNAAMKSRCQPNIQKGLDAMIGKQALPLPTGIHIHTLRSIYAALVYELYDCTHTFCRTAQLVLGHACVVEGLAYSHIKVYGCERGRFGPLTLA